ncbi:15-hydroxyprostaglandin dehydrogenase [NAD(+)] [Triplophysa rosa]|uniref:15-hydroxyprostaglandin dehydrogenase [NAD(+)] n=1 Tax=Triplophysa rosa TaxID=992332 RepID=A0A9W7TGG0_TRIRA|nr:15-hydroxyprostaglandin dehydrogenase [NAD(+)] [Triplophysa rosa]KAI7795622.1 hypothetical protein IRJ41_001705 [Triplophysa rosa]
MDLKDKVAVVTGGAQGLGRSFVEILLKNGAKVAIVDMNESLGSELKATLDNEYGPDRTEFYIADVSSQEQFAGAFQKAIERFGCFDIMCNNAGIIDEKNWEKSIAVNLGGVIRGTYLALQQMRSEKDVKTKKVIINISSVAGLGPMITAPVYSGTEHGVVGFSRSMAAAVKAANASVRINVLCPWFVNTSLMSFLNSEEQIGHFCHFKDVTEKALEKHGILETDDVAKAFLTLVTDESKEGEVIFVDTDGVKTVPPPGRPSRE